MDNKSNQERVRALNDEARRHLTGGTVYFTRGIAALPAAGQATIFSLVCAFDKFTPDNDPYGEHDFGSFEHNGKLIFWKIDSYDLQDRYASPNPADPRVTHRVLTIMLADEY